MYLIRTPEGDYEFDDRQMAQEWVRLLLKTHEEHQIAIFMRVTSRPLAWSQPG